MYLSEKIFKRENCFDFLRFFAAILVIFSHSYPLLGYQKDWLTLRIKSGMSFGSLAVSIFFIISGFLITASWYNQKQIIPFLKNRILRLYPALIFVVLVSFFIVGPIFSDLSVKDYFLHSGSVEYLWNMTIIKFKSSIPSVFAQNVYKDTFNGSLWTLRTELHCYLIVAVLGVLGLFKRKFFWYLWSIPFLIWFFGVSHSNELYFVILFLIGQMYYLLKDKIQLNKSIAILAVVGFAGYLFLSDIHFIIRNFLLVFSLPYLIFYLAYNLPILNNFSKYGDFSYGLYIYAFPVQQIVSNLTGGDLSIKSFFFISFLITFLCSIFSWYFIEKRALSLKKISLRKTMGLVSD